MEDHEVARMLRELHYKKCDDARPFPEPSPHPPDNSPRGGIAYPWAACFVNDRTPSEDRF